MITVIYAHKAGQGVTTIAATLATLTACRHKRTLLVDTGTDLPAVLGIREGHRPGLADYLTDTNITLADIVTSVSESLDLITRGDHAAVLTAANYGLLTGGLDHYDTVIIDAAPDAREWVRHADLRVLVTRPCYLALRHATGQRRPDHLVVITEHGRALNPGDIEAVTGTPITANVPYDAAIARAVDAGTLNTRLPRTLSRALAPLLAATIDGTVSR
jgi:cellulose biosynthesis protein BcsQ